MHVYRRTLAENRIKQSMSRWGELPG